MKSPSESKKKPARLKAHVLKKIADARPKKKALDALARARAKGVFAV